MTEADATARLETTETSRSPSTAELQRDIEQTRDELAATVAALTAKVNVPARVRESSAGCACAGEAVRVKVHTSSGKGKARSPVLERSGARASCSLWRWPPQRSWAGC